MDSGPQLPRVSRDAYRQLLKENPDDGDLWLRYATWLDEEDCSPADAAQAYEVAESLLPGRSDICLLRGLALVEAGKVVEGTKVILERLRACPSSHGYCILGRIAFNRGKYATAARMFKKAISLDADFEEPYYFMGRVFQDAGDWGGAIPFYEQAIEIDKHYVLAWQQLGVCLLHDQQRLSEAVRVLRHAVSLEPSEPWSLAYLGNALWQTGDAKGALLCFQQAHNIRPNDSDFAKWWEEARTAFSEA